MNFICNEIMNIVYQRFQNNTCQTSCTAYQNSGKNKKLISAEPVVQPMQDKLITARFFQSVFLEISFKFKEAKVLFFVVNFHLGNILHYHQIDKAA